MNHTSFSFILVAMLTLLAGCSTFIIRIDGCIGWSSRSKAPFIARLRSEMTFRSRDSRYSCSSILRKLIKEWMFSIISWSCATWNSHDPQEIDLVYTLCCCDSCLIYWIWHLDPRCYPAFILNYTFLIMLKVSFKISKQSKLN